MSAAVTGWAVQLPGFAGSLGGFTPGPGCPPEEARALLGRKGLLGKEPATRLALCAVHRALGRPDGQRLRVQAPDPGTAVVASSNLGNVHTVCTLAAELHKRGCNVASPLDAPNVSSNVVASSVAIWFGFGGPNLMVCSGQPSGLDAVGLGRLLLTAGRAARVVVVGVEPDDPTAAALLGAPLRAAAACVVLEPEGRVALGPVRETAGPARTEVTAGSGAVVDIDLPGVLGPTYGALGVLQVAVGAAHLAAGARSALAVCGDAVDGHRCVELTAGAGR